MSPAMHRAPAVRSRARVLRRVVAATAAFSAGFVGLAPAFAVELVTAELVGTHNVVEVEQGESADFTINLGVTGNAGCGSTHTAKVKNTYSVSAAGAVSSGTTFSNPVNFSAPGTGNGNCDINGSETVPATITAAATTLPGTYTVTLSTAAGTTQVTSSNSQGGKLTDDTATTLTFLVTAPANSAPVAAPDRPRATRPAVEGSTLQAAGSFTDVDNNLASITASAGTITPATDANGKLTGAWSWTLATTDQVSGSVTVTARDAANATAPQTFTYSAANVAPQVSIVPSPAVGLEGDTLVTTGAFSDVPADPLTITQSSGAGTVTDNGKRQRGPGRSPPATRPAARSSCPPMTVTVARTRRASTTAPPTSPRGSHRRRKRERQRRQHPDQRRRLQRRPRRHPHRRRRGAGTLTTGPSNGAWSWTLDATDDATGSVSVTANDGVATSTPDTFDYTVNNVDPFVTLEANDATGNEGTELSTTGSFSDVAADTLTVAKVSGPGQVTDNGDGAWSWSLAGTDDLTGKVVVRATDGDAGTIEDTFDVSVLNLAPAVVGSVADATGSEGTTLLAHGSFCRRRGRHDRRRLDGRRHVSWTRATASGPGASKRPTRPAAASP